MANNVDFSAVKLEWDKSSYAKGDTMTLTLRGEAVVTEGGETYTVGPFEIPVSVAGSDEQWTIPVPAVEVGDGGESHNEAVKFTGPPEDPSGRAWIVATDGLSMAATA